MPANIARAQGNENGHETSRALPKEVILHRIVVITHEFDQFQKRRWSLGPMKGYYMLFDVLGHLCRRGYEVEVLKGVAHQPPGDVGVLHVDATYTTQDYVDYARTFPFCLNLATTDISKRAISGALLAPGEAWEGAVMVKSNLNNRGLPEAKANARAMDAGRPRPYAAPDTPRRYEIYGDIGQVPDDLFQRTDLVIEKFMPEVEPDGYAARFWSFCGEAERCTRYVSPHPLVKAEDTIRSEKVPVPDEIRALRERLGFDYGKFDFVVHAGKPVLLDANKTPGGSRNLSAALKAGAMHLADGLENLIRVRL